MLRVPVKLGLVDVACQEKYYRLRPLTLAIYALTGLLNRGSDLTVADLEVKKLLHAESFFGEQEAIAEFLRRVARIVKRDSYVPTALHYAVCNSKFFCMI
jgi:hypothetical protein